MAIQVCLRCLLSSDLVHPVRIALAALQCLAPVDTWKWVPVVVEPAVDLQPARLCMDPK